MADDLQTQIDDLTQRLDDNDQSLSDYSDNLDSNLSDIQSSLDDNAQNLDDLNQNEGQLMFPLSQDTIDLITEQAPTMLQYLYDKNYIGTATLTLGKITLTNPLVSSTSLILLSVIAQAGTPGLLSYTAGAGTFTINSDSGTDASTIIYFILN